MREACRRLGWERKTLAHAKSAGLQTIRFGRFDYVRGADLLSFFDRLAGQSNAEGSAWLIPSPILLLAPSKMGSLPG